MLSFYLISALISSTLMVHLAANVLLDYPRRTGAWAFAGFLGGSAAYVLQHSLPAGSAPYSVIYGLFLLNETVPWFLWIFARSICVDNAPRIGWRWLPLVGLMALNIWVMATGQFDGWVYRASDVVKLATCIAAVWVLVHENRDDLVDLRRRIRHILLWIAAVITVFVLFLERAPIAGLNQSSLVVALRLIILGLSLAFSFGYFRLKGDALAAIAGSRPLSKPREASSGSTPASLLARRVMSAMTDEYLYRENGLTIGALAKHLREPEYRVRQAINAELGYRNFSAFLNHFRLGEAEQWLGDPEKRHLPVLTIALEVGFNSIAPFNRAFKARFGQTPTEHRAGLTQAEPPKTQKT